MAKSPPEFISRRNQRRDLLTLLTGLKPGDEITYEEIQAFIGLDVNTSGDRDLLYSIIEHCGAVGGFIIEVLAKKGLRRVPDNEIANRTVVRRRDRILRQALRGAAESTAIGDFASLDVSSQRQLLAHQAVFGTIALVSTLDAVKAVDSTIHKKKLVVAPNSETVIAVVRKIDQK